jgi:twitching motility protein PilT
MELLDLLARLAAADGSDLHLVVGQPPVFRIAGSLERQGEVALDAEGMEALILPHMTDAQKEALRHSAARDVEWTVRHAGASFRMRAFYERGRLAGAARRLPSRVPTLDDLGLGADFAPTLTKLTKLLRGLVVVTGPTGSGKSTLVAALIEEVNRTRAERIVTVENPIEYEFDSKLSLITQRSVGEDVGDFLSALRSALRMDPDIVWVSEPTSLEVMQMTLTLADAGHLVFLTMNTDTASIAVNRIIEAYPEGQQPVIRHLLARNLMAVVAQKLLPRASGAGRVAAQEILIGTPRVRQMIRDGYADFTLAMEAGREQGMQTMDDAILRYHEAGTINRDLASFYLEDKTRLATGEGVASAP